MTPNTIASQASTTAAVHAQDEASTSASAESPGMAALRGMLHDAALGTDGATAAEPAAPDLLSDLPSGVQDTIADRLRPMAVACWSATNKSARTQLKERLPGRTPYWQPLIATSGADVKQALYEFKCQPGSHIDMQIDGSLTSLANHLADLPEDERSSAFRDILDQKQQRLGIGYDIGHLTLEALTASIGHLPPSQRSEALLALQPDLIDWHRIEFGEDRDRLRARAQPYLDTTGAAIGHLPREETTATIARIVDMMPPEGKPVVESGLYHDRLGSLSAHDFQPAYMNCLQRVVTGKEGREWAITFANRLGGLSLEKRGPAFSALIRTAAVLPHPSQSSLILTFLARSYFEVAVPEQYAAGLRLLTAAQGLPGDHRSGIAGELMNAAAKVIVTSSDNEELDIAMRLATKSRDAMK